MGIQGLLPVLKSISKRAHVSKYAGKKVAVDAYSWLHKGAYSCSMELCEGVPTDKYVVYCMQKVALLRSCGVIPVIVFDGGKLPMKEEEESARAKSRKDNLEKAQAHLRAGNKSAAFDCYQRAVDISPAAAKQFIEALKAEGVEFIVAPYEADSQMAFLAINQRVHAVITEDSDLLPYGCPHVFFKMDRVGEGQEICIGDLGLNRDLGFVGFSPQMFLEMCILAGCDFLKALPGIGMKKAYQQMRKSRTFVRVCKSLRFSGTSVPRGYEAAFQRAIWTFQHQRVFDSETGRVVHLRPLPEGGLVEAAGVSGALPEDDSELRFLGPPIADDVAAEIARGNLDPITRRPFGDSSHHLQRGAASVTALAGAQAQTGEKRAVQRGMSSYFAVIPSSDKCADRACAAPRSAPGRPAGPLGRLSGSSVWETQSQPEASREDVDSTEQPGPGTGLQSQAAAKHRSTGTLLPQLPQRSELYTKPAHAMRFGPSTAGASQLLSHATAAPPSAQEDSQEPSDPGSSASPRGRMMRGGKEAAEETVASASSPSAIVQRLGLPSSPCLDDLFPPKPDSRPSSTASPPQLHGPHSAAVERADTGSLLHQWRIGAQHGSAGDADQAQPAWRGGSGLECPQGLETDRNGDCSARQASCSRTAQEEPWPGARVSKTPHRPAVVERGEALERRLGAGGSDAQVGAALFEQEGEDAATGGLLTETPGNVRAFYAAITPEAGLASKAARAGGAPASASVRRHPLALVENTPLPKAAACLADPGKTPSAEPGRTRSAGSSDDGQLEGGAKPPAKRRYSHFFAPPKKRTINAGENIPAGDPKSDAGAGLQRGPMASQSQGNLAEDELEEGGREEVGGCSTGAFHSLGHIQGYAATASKVIGRLAAQRGMGACGSQAASLCGLEDVRKPFRAPRPGVKEPGSGGAGGRFGKFAFMTKEAAVD